MSDKYLSIDIDPAKLMGHLMKAIAKNENLRISTGKNKSETPNAPDFVNTSLGVGVWVKESTFDSK